jgi:hypothetical protein
MMLGYLGDLDLPGLGDPAHPVQGLIRGAAESVHGQRDAHRPGLVHQGDAAADAAALRRGAAAPKPGQRGSWRVSGQLTAVSTS